MRIKIKHCDHYSFALSFKFETEAWGISEMVCFIVAVVVVVVVANESEAKNVN